MMKKTAILTLLITSMVCAKQTEAQLYESCGLNKKSQKLAQFVIEAKAQHRTTLICNQSLAEVANQKAKMMAKTGQVSHYIENISPNEMLVNSGVELPYYYERLGNQVEAVSGGMKTPQKAFEHFMTSEVHKSHLMGEHEFYLQQNHIGVGHYTDPKKSHVDYWVIYITALREQGDRPQSVLNIKPGKLRVSKKAQKSKKKRKYSSLNTIIK